MLPVSRCEECKNTRSPVDVLQKFDVANLPLEELASLNVNCQSIGASSLPTRYEDFLQWDASQLLFTSSENTSSHSARSSADDSDDDEGHSEFTV